jgi:hypothetical protein
VECVVGGGIFRFWAIVGGGHLAAIGHDSKKRGLPPASAQTNGHGPRHCRHGPWAIDCYGGACVAQLSVCGCWEMLPTIGKANGLNH